MRHILVSFGVLFSGFISGMFSQLAMAQEKINDTIDKIETSSPVKNIEPQVGTHVGGNIDAMSMVLSLLMVLALIIVVAFILKKLQPGGQVNKGMKIVSSLSLGAKERLIVVQVGKKQQLLGVTSQQITLLDTLEEPLEIEKPLANEIGQSFISLIQKQRQKKESLQIDPISSLQKKQS